MSYFHLQSDKGTFIYCLRCWVCFPRVLRAAAGTANTGPEPLALWELHWPGPSITFTHLHTHVPSAGFSVSQSLRCLQNELRIAFSPAPVSPRWDLPTASPLSHFRSFSIHFHLSDRQVAVDSLRTALVQKQTQKKAEKNVGTDAASDLCGAAPRAVGSVLLCHPRDVQGPSGTPPWKAGARPAGECRSLTKCSTPKSRRTPAGSEGLG